MLRKLRIFSKIDIVSLEYMHDYKYNHRARECLCYNVITYNQQISPKCLFGERGQEMPNNMTSLQSLENVGKCELDLKNAPVQVMQVILQKLKVWLRLLNRSM